MARINLIPPELLTDQHLMAEKREINLLAGCFKKSFNSKNGINFHSYPKEYLLNRGHIKFFYDKRIYLITRYYSLCDELVKRKYNISFFFNDTWKQIDVNNLDNYDTTFIPNKENYKIIIDRILDKISMKPEWYKYYGKTINFNEYTNNLITFYNNL